MQYVPRKASKIIEYNLERGKSILLMGPRQTGKSTLLLQLRTSLSLSMADPRLRQRYERSPQLLLQELTALKKDSLQIPLVILDEIQKVPQLMDVVQLCIDTKIAQFVLTGSSARKLKTYGDRNFLPGRVQLIRLDPFSMDEFLPEHIEVALADGSLPAINLEKNANDRDADLSSYVETYLEDEIRSEALVRGVGTFSRFLELAALESGRVANFREIAKDLSISHTTVSSYFEILEDCFIAERIVPLSRSASRKKLTKSPRFLIFDLGVRRACAREGQKLTSLRLGELFEQWIGLELIRHARGFGRSRQVMFWRDPAGPEVDWIWQNQEDLVPLEVKWTEAPDRRDAKHVETFLAEYPEATKGYVVCRTPRRFQLTERIVALPWQELLEACD